MFERRDVWKLGSEADPWDPIIRWYARAITALKGRAQKDPTSWRYFAAIHGTRIPRSEWPQGGTETFQERRGLVTAGCSEIEPVSLLVRLARLAGGTLSSA